MSDSLRLFLLEPNDDLALLVQKSLERYHHRVTRSRFASDALLVLANGQFDLVLLDRTLPDMTGLAFLERLHNDNITIPALVVGELGDEASVADLLHAGALDYLVKDEALTFLSELPNRIAEALRRHRLEQSNSLLLQALESARDGVMIVDLKGDICNVNRALVEMTGYPRQDLIGSRPSLFASAWKHPDGRQPWQGELTLECRDNTTRDVSLSWSPILNSRGRPTHHVGILRDMTEYNQLQQQLLQSQKMQSIGTLAGGVAHEFNNILAGINGYASLGLGEEGVGGELRDFLQHIVALSQRAALLTRQLLAFARKPTLVRESTSIPELVEATVEMIRRTLYQGVHLDLPESGEVRLLADADANQLQQALVNLAVNARDSLCERANQASAKPIVFRVRHVVSKEPHVGFPHSVPPGDYVCISVQDEGVGMEGAVLERAIEPFFTTKEVGKGTGLGLPMVYGLVEGHRGCLTIESAPNLGTIVSVYLPRLQEVAESSQHAASPAAPLPETARELPCDILVVDDERSVRDVLKRFLRLAGHRVSTVASGRRAAEWLTRADPVDLIVLDLKIPRENVRSTLRQIKQLRSDVPILLCTGTTDEDAEHDLYPLGVAGMVRKPFQMDELCTAVRQVLQASQR